MRARYIISALAPVLVMAISLGFIPVASAKASPCVSTKAEGSCGAYYVPRQIAGSNGYNTYVQQNVWGPIPGWHQKLVSRSPGNWYIIANMPRGNTAVVSYPNIGQIMSDPRNDQRSLPLSGYASIQSSFTENMHVTRQTDSEAAYDIWLNDYKNEVMIQTDNYGGQADVCGKTHVAFGGWKGVPVKRTWTFCNLGDELIFQLPGKHVKSTSVGILAMLRWLAKHHYFKSSSTLTAIGYGFEVCSTGGVNERMQVSRYTLHATYKKGI